MSLRTITPVERARTGGATDWPSELVGASVRRCAVATELDSPLVELCSAEGIRILANREHALVVIPQVASFSIRSGQEVLFQPQAGAHEAEVEAYLHGTVTGLVLAQQRRFALHANAVQIAGVTLALAGKQQAGKSTASLALGKRGHELLGDDIVILEPQTGGVREHTTPRPLHVTPDVARTFAAQLGALRPLGPRSDKLAAAHAHSPPGPLHGVIVLRVCSVERVTVREITGLARLRLVESNAYRVGLLRAVWPRELLEWAGLVAARVPAYVLARPAGQVTLPQVTDAIERIAADLKLHAPFVGGDVERSAAELSQ